MKIITTILCIILYSFLANAASLTDSNSRLHSVLCQSCSEQIAKTLKRFDETYEIKKLIKRARKFKEFIKGDDLSELQELVSYKYHSPVLRSSRREFVSESASIDDKNQVHSRAQFLIDDYFIPKIKKEYLKWLKQKGETTHEISAKAKKQFVLLKTNNKNIRIEEKYMFDFPMTVDNGGYNGYRDFKSFGIYQSIERKVTPTVNGKYCLLKDLTLRFHRIRQQKDKYESTYSDAYVAFDINIEDIHYNIIMENGRHVNLLDALNSYLDNVCEGLITQEDIESYYEEK